MFGDSDLASKTHAFACSSERDVVYVETDFSELSDLGLLDPELSIFAAKN